MLVDVDRLMQTVALEDGEPAGGPEDAGEFYDGFVRQRRAATKDYVGRIMTAKELLRFWGQIPPRQKDRVPLVVFGNPFSEGLRSVLQFKGMHDCVSNGDEPVTKEDRAVLAGLLHNTRLPQ